MSAIAGRRIEWPERVRTINGVTCVRLNTVCGFSSLTQDVLDRCVAEGGIAVVYAHPHSLTSAGPQREGLLQPFLRRVSELRQAGRLEVVLPRDLRVAA
jgi:hypothetical protein